MRASACLFTGVLRRLVSTSPRTSGSSIILMFPGQGAQRVGMGLDLANEFAVARNVFEEVDEALGESLSKVMFHGDGAELTKTAKAQPALLAHSVAALRVLTKEHGIVPRGAVLGASVGEYAALVAAGSLSLPVAARLLRTRGEAMQAAADADAQARKTSHAMIAIVFSSDKLVSEIYKTINDACERVSKDTGLVASLAAINAPTQFVLSGHTAALDAVVKALRVNNDTFILRRAIPISVSAPFHCAVMAPATKALRAALDHIPIGDAHLAPLISGYNALETTTALDVKDVLVKGVEATVRWTEAVAVAAAKIADKDNNNNDDDDSQQPHFLELGPGTTLSTFVRALRPNARVSSVGNVSDVRKWV